MTAIQSGAPSISVVMSCYNAERWLAESIESVLNQTWQDFEFIIVDDGSTDETASIIARFAAVDERIVPVSKSNTGLADSLNTGIARARSTWIARLDADDLCEPDRLALQWRTASANPALVFVGTGLVLIDEHGQPFAVHRYPTRHRKLVAHLTTARKFPAHSSAFFRADAFRRVGGYRPRIRRAEDWDLWLRLSEIGRLASVHKPLVRIRKHSDQISHDESGQRQIVDAHVAMISYWLRYLNQTDPVAAEDTEFEYFRSWVVEKLKEKNYFFLCTMSQILKEIKHKPSRVLIFSLTQRLLNQPRLVLRFMKNRLTGSTLPYYLANQWINFHKIKS